MGCQRARPAQAAVVRPVQCAARFHSLWKRHAGLLPRLRETATDLTAVSWRKGGQNGSADPRWPTWPSAAWMGAAVQMRNQSEAAVAMMGISSETAALGSGAAASPLSGSGSSGGVVIAVSCNSATLGVARHAFALARCRCCCRSRRSSWSSWRESRFTSLRDATSSQRTNGCSSCTAGASSCRTQGRPRAAAGRRPGEGSRSRSTALLSCDTRLRTARARGAIIRSSTSFHGWPGTVWVLVLASDAGGVLPDLFGRKRCDFLIIPPPPGSAEETQLSAWTALQPPGHAFRLLRKPTAPTEDERPSHAAYDPREIANTLALPDPLSGSKKKRSS